MLVPTKQDNLRRPSKKKYYLGREIVPISSDTPTVGPVSEHFDYCEKIIGSGKTQYFPNIFPYYPLINNKI